MKTQSRSPRILAPLLFLAAGFQTVYADLPSLNEHPWMGHFVAAEDKKFEFGFTAQGRGKIVPLDSKGNPVSEQNSLSLVLGIEEVLPDGKTRMKQVDVSSLESAEPATLDFKKVTIRGKVTGGAAFETTIESDRGAISVGGRVTDPGSLKNPLRFVAQVNIPNVYSKAKKETKDEIKDFERTIKSDRLELKWTDGKRVKEKMEKSIDAGSKEINGPGISDVEVDLDAYKGAKLIFSATQNSAIRLTNGKVVPLYEGFEVNWSPDEAKDKDGKARFTIQIK